MTTYQILCLIGIPSLISTASTMVISHFSKERKENANRIEAVENGLQALLRDRLLQSYFYHKDKGVVTVHEKDNFKNMYNELNTNKPIVYFDSINLTNDDAGILTLEGANEF